MEEENKTALLEEMRQSYEMVRFFDNQYFRILAIFTAFYLGSIGYLLQYGQNIVQPIEKEALIFIFWSIFGLIFIIIRKNSIWNLRNWSRINIIRKKLSITTTLPSKTIIDDEELSKKLDSINVEKEKEVIDFVELLFKKRGWRGPIPKSSRLIGILAYFLILTGVISIIILN